MENTASRPMPTEALGVALVGTGFMGKAHAMAWHNVATVFGGAHPRLEILCDATEALSQRFAGQFGFARATTDWQAVLADAAVNVVSITTPNGLHRSMAEAALAAGKHVWLEKPMALTLEDAEAMAAMASAHPEQVTLLGYNYLRNPAFQAAAQMIRDGVIGTPKAFRGVYDEDYSADPDLAWSWRMTHEGGGLGALGDLGCHLVSQMLALMGPVAEITAFTQIAIPARPSPEGPKAVENEDGAYALVRFASGALGSFATSRVAHGRKCRLQWEVHGSDGTIVFDQENMNELWICRAGEAGFVRHLTGPEQPDFAAFCPAPGHNFGFNEQKVIEARDLVSAIAGGPKAQPDFAEGLIIERIIHAMASSNGRPVTLADTNAPGGKSREQARPMAARPAREQKKMTQTFTLAACAEMLWLDKPIEWRCARLDEMGFAVGLWNWPDHDLDQLEKSGARFSIMNGYLRGRLTDDDGAEELLKTARETAQVGKRLGVERLNLHGTGLGEGGLPVTPVETITGAMWLKAEETLRRICDLAEEEGVTFTLENLNLPVDHPGVPFARAEDTLALVAAIDCPRLRLNLDLYHAQIGEGNLIELCRAALPWIGEIQVADVPGRCEPGTGEINFAGIARALVDMGYHGPVGMEAWAQGDPERALDAFRAAFTP